MQNAATGHDTTERSTPATIVTGFDHRRPRRSPRSSWSSLHRWWGSGRAGGRRGRAGGTSVPTTAPPQYECRRDARDEECGVPRRPLTTSF